MGPDENALVERAKAGDAEAFGALVEAHAKRVYALAYRFCWDHDDADDITQETFVRAFEYLRSFREGSDLGPWLYRIAVNRCISHRKRQQRDAERGSLAAPETHSDPSPGELAETIAISSHVQQEIRRLPGRQRAAIVLFELEGLSVAETASAMGCSAGTVKRHLHRARNTLRKRLLDVVEDTSEKLGGAEVELQDCAPHDEPARGQTASE
jgi:RNA polymerase sigma-70 factor (ECF subfamily)